MRVQIASGPVDPAVLFGVAIKFNLRDAPPARTPTEPELKAVADDLAVHMRSRAEAEGIRDAIACECGRKFPDLPDLKHCPFCGEEIVEADVGATPAVEHATAKSEKPKKKAPKDIVSESQANTNGSKSNARVTPDVLTTPAVQIERKWEFIRERSRASAGAFWEVGDCLMEIKRTGLMSADPLFAEAKTFERLIEMRTGWTKQHAYRAMQFANSVKLEQIEQHTGIGVEGWSLIVREVAQLPAGERSAAAGEAASAIGRAPKTKGKSSPARSVVKKAARDVVVARGGKIKGEAEPKESKKRSAVIGMLAGREQIKERRFDLTGTVNARHELPYRHPKTGEALSRPRDLKGLFIELKLEGGHSMVIRLGKTLAEVTITKRASAPAK